MVHSYKPVLMKSFLRRLPELVFPFDGVAEEFVAFYQDRAERGLVVEREGCVFVTSRGVRADEAAKTARRILDVVFGSGHGLVRLRAGRCQLVGDEWLCLGGDMERQAMARFMDAATDRFFKRINDLGEGVYVRLQQSHPAHPSVVFHLPDPDESGPLLLLRPGDSGMA
jgi:hypothetical protein